MDKENDSDYGLRSGDEADLGELAVRVSSPPPLKRTAQSSKAPSPKRRKVESDANQANTASQLSTPLSIKDEPVSLQTYPSTSPLAQNTLKTHFGLGGFRLKQEAAIARLLAGGNAVVVFPTGERSSTINPMASTSTDYHRWWKESLLSSTFIIHLHYLAFSRETGSSICFRRSRSPAPCPRHGCGGRHITCGLTSDCVNERPG